MSDTAPLRDAQFRRLWSAGLLGALVRWLEILVFGVFAYQQTRSAFWVASMTMLRMLPMALFGVLFGAVAARISRRSGLLATQGVLLATSIALLLVSAFGALEVWHLAAASFINGAAWAGDNPLRRALMGDIVGPLRMGHAMALDAVANNACRLLGPMLGGVLLAQAGMTAVFALTALLYALALAALLTLSEPAAPITPAKSGAWSMLVGGFAAARETPSLAATLCITILFNIFCWPVLSMVPVIGQERLQLGTQQIGLLASMDGVGALLGAIALASLARKARYGHVYVGGMLVFLAGLLMLALAAHPLMAGVAMLVIGLGQSGFAAMQTTLVFVTAPPQRRLEAMGLLTMCIGIAPLGFIAVGWLAERVGAPTATVIFALGGFAALAMSWPLWRPCVREE